MIFLGSSSDEPTILKNQQPTPYLRQHNHGPVEPQSVPGATIANSASAWVEEFMLFSSASSIGSEYPNVPPLALKIIASSRIDVDKRPFIETRAIRPLAR